MRRVLFEAERPRPRRAEELGCTEPRCCVLSPVPGWSSQGLESVVDLRPGGQAGCGHLSLDKLSGLAAYKIASPVAVSLPGRCPPCL